MAGIATTTLEYSADAPGYVSIADNYIMDCKEWVNNIVTAFGVDSTAQPARVNETLYALGLPWEVGVDGQLIAHGPEHERMVAEKRVPDVIISEESKVLLRIHGVSTCPEFPRVKRILAQRITEAISYELTGNADVLGVGLGHLMDDMLNALMGLKDLGIIGDFQATNGMSTLESEKLIDLDSYLMNLYNALQARFKPAADI